MQKIDVLRKVIRPLVSKTFNRQSHVSFDVFAFIQGNESCNPMMMKVLAFLFLFSHYKVIYQFDFRS
jgi:hypothetical protein